MKKISALLIGIVLLSACTSVEEEISNEGSTTEELPEEQFTDVSGDIQKGFVYESVNDFSLEFPKEWTGVQGYYDFSGFGSTDESPLCVVCGRSTLFGFPNEEDKYWPYYLFQIMKINIEDKGSEYIPADFEYLGESVDFVFYAAVVRDTEWFDFIYQDLPLDYEALLTQTPEIFGSFKALPEGGY